MAIETAPGKGASTGIMTDPRVLNTLPLDLQESAQVEVASENALTPQAIDQIVGDKYSSLARSLHSSRPEIDPVGLVSNLKTSTSFKEEGVSHFQVRDAIKLLRYFHDRTESYDEKREKEARKGKDEASAYGVSEINGERFVFFTTHFDYFQGTLGVDMGERFSRAANLAIEHNLSLVGLFASAGARQQEGAPAVDQMYKVVRAVNRFKAATKLPYVSILDDSWGGITASAALLGDVNIGIRGSGLGFAGRRVIEQFFQKENIVPDGAQSVESNFLNRTIEMVVNDEDELLMWLDQMLRISILLRKDKPSIPKASEDQQLTLPVGYKQFPFSEPRILNRIGPQNQLVNGEELRASIDAMAPSPTQEREPYVDTMTPHDQYEMLLRNPFRPDTDLLSQLIFDEVLPLYSIGVVENEVYYRPLIYGLGVIGDQVYGFGGNQPSYRLSLTGRLSKVPAQPLASDFEVKDDAFDFFQRLGVPVVSFIDTPGAYPSIDQERMGLAKKIARSTSKGDKYPYPEITYTTGIFGSGGGVGSGPYGEVVKMSSLATKLVAAPPALSSIVYNTKNPSRDQQQQVTNESKITAHEVFDLKLTDGSILEPEGGSQMDVLAVAQAFRTDIIRSTRRHSGENRKNMMERRDKRIDNLGGKLIVNRRRLNK